jgi:kynurenine formamidase
MEKKDVLLDLTHTLREGIPLWDESCIYQVQLKADTGSFKLMQLAMECSAGTHLDAPYHLNPEGLTIDKIPLENLVVDCKTIHIPEADQDFKLTVDDLKNFEIKSGPIRQHQFILIHTGWDRHWHDPIRYMNNYHFPSISKEAAKYLVEKKIVGIGIDTPSPDSTDSDFSVHSILLRNNIYIVENVAHAGRMPPNAKVMIFPLKGGGLSEAPVRMVGFWH